MSVIVIIGLVGVSRKTIFVFGASAARTFSTLDGVDVRELQAELLADLAEEAVRAAVHVLAGDDVIARLQHAEDGVGRRHARGEAVPVFAAFERRQVRLEHGARRIFRPRVFVAFVPAELRLDVGRGLEDRIGDGAGDRLRLLAGVNAIGGETHVSSLSRRDRAGRIENAPASTR